MRFAGGFLHHYEEMRAENAALRELLATARDGLRRADVHLARDRQYADKEQRAAARSTITETLAAIDTATKGD